MSIGLVFAAVANCKKAYDVVNNIRKVPEEAYYLWQLLDAMAPAFRTLCRLNSREASYVLVNKAVEAVYECVLLCDTLLARDDPDGRPHEADSWDAWWAAIPARAKEGMTRVQLVPKMVARLQHCMTLVQLSLLNVQVSQSVWVSSKTTGVKDHNKQSSDLRIAGAQRARHVYHLFESGRLECCGNQYQIGQGVLYCRREKTVNGGGSTSAAGPVVCVGEVGVILRRSSHRKQEQQSAAATSQPTTETYEIIFVNADDVAANAREVHFGPESGRTTAASNSTNGSKSVEICGVMDFASSAWCVRCADAADDSFGPSNGAASAVVQYSFSQLRGAHDKQPLSVAAANAEKQVALAVPMFYLEFSSCLLASQFCYFPTSSERYHHVTAEAFEAIFAIAAAVSSGAGNDGRRLKQVDEVMPLVESALPWDPHPHEVEVVSTALLAFLDNTVSYATSV